MTGDNDLPMRSWPKCQIIPTLHTINQATLTHRHNCITTSFRTPPQLRSVKGASGLRGGPTHFCGGILAGSRTSTHSSLCRSHIHWHPLACTALPGAATFNPLSGSRLQGVTAPWMKNKGDAVLRIRTHNNHHRQPQPPMWASRHQQSVDIHSCFAPSLLLISNCKPLTCAV